jgi:mono/diheme cytochrome c family protein
MMVKRAGLAIGLLMALLLVTGAQAQELRPGRLSKEVLATLRPGLALEFKKGAFGETYDARIARVPALYVAKETAPSPFVAPGPLMVLMQGYLKVPLKGKHNFHVHTTGPIKLMINGQELLNHWQAKPADRTLSGIPLVKGYNELRILFRSDGKADAGFRIGWSGEGFIEEPLPADALFTRGDEKPLVAALALREGRELLATRSCTKCHFLNELAASEYSGGMPELGAKGPSLAGVGARLNENWLQAWIRAPRKLRPSATMPHVLHGDEATQTQAAADLAAYLMTLVAEPAAAVETTDELAAEGVKLFENLGCIACHSTKPPDEADPFDRLSLHYVAAKFNSGSLYAYLKSPHAIYPWTRMPDFKLSDEEATALTAYLLTRARGEIEVSQDAPAGDATRGKLLFTTAGCASCHDVAKTSATTKPIAIKENSAGCLAAVPSKKSPDFGFTEAQRSALGAFIATDRSSLERDTPAEFSLRQVQSLNCIACHRRDGANSKLWSVLEEEGEQGLTPEVLPLLTWTGEKLKPQWSEKLLAGELDGRARPWLRARMPAFPARAKLLAIGLSHEHGFAVDENPTPKHDVELAKVGQQLVGDNNGFSCIKCHAIGKRPPLAPFEAPGINLVSAAERLRYSYFPRWMLDPPRVDVLTKMPKFAADGTTTGVTSVFDGDARRQNEALWHYIQTLPSKEK